jgi:hypothetical protein
MSNNLRTIIRKVLVNFLNEAYSTPHLKLRTNQRVEGKYTFSSEVKSKQLGKKQFTTISDLESKKNQILFNLNFLEKVKFPLEGIAVKVFDFEKNKFVTHFYDELEGEIGNINISANFKKIKKEVGDALWVIIRNNKMMTLHSTKGSKKPGNVEHFLEIDSIKEYVKEKDDYNLDLDDINNIKKIEKKLKISEPEKEEIDPHLLKFNVDGVNYIADSNLEQVYKKNKPNEKYDGYDFVEDLTKKAKEEFDNKNIERANYFVKKCNEILAHFLN